MVSFICGIQETKWTKKKKDKPKNRLLTIENKWMVTERRWGWRDG